MGTTRDVVNFQRASLLAAKSFERMARENLPPTPENHILWYNYYGDYYPQLTTEIKVMEDCGGLFTEDRCRALYQKYFSVIEEAEVIRQHSNKAVDALSSSKTALLSLKGDMGLHEHLLGRLQSTFDEACTPDEVHALISNVTNESKLLQDKFSQMILHFDKVAADISSMLGTISGVMKEKEVDALTKLLNKRGFDSRYREFINYARDSDEELSIMVAGIDSLGSLNKRFGLLVGDHVLKLFAKLMTQTCGDMGVVARYAGDRFAVITPGQGLEEAVKLAEQLRLKIGTQELVNKTTRKTFGAITVSVGVTSLRRGEGASQLFERAEALLIAAKKKGRNCVCAD